jgi:predicted deacylase
MIDVQIGELRVAPGSKLAGVQKLQVANQEVEMVLFVINGTEDGPTLVVTAGIHGAEYASIEAALQLGRSLIPERLHGRVAPVANMPAFRARVISVCPLDGKNLNHLFPGKADGTASEQLVNWLFQNVILQADYYVDLHGGDLVEVLIPFTALHRSGNEAVDKKSLELAEVFGIEDVAWNDALGGTYAAAAEAGIPALLAESGGHGLWPREAVEVLTQGLDRLMRHLGMREGPRPDPVPTVSTTFLWLRSEHTGFYYPQVEVGQVVGEGEELGAVTDFRGNVLGSVLSPAEGRVLFLVTSLAINKGDSLLGLGV